MFVVEVIPLRKGINVASLSYFSKADYPYGTLVTIPIRGRDVQGVVISSEPVSATKATLRSAGFRLRRLPAQDEPPRLPRSLLATAHELAQRTPAHLGSILFALLPKEVRNGDMSYPSVTDVEHAEDTTPFVLQAKYEERLVHYRSFIRTALAHRGSTLLVAPTAAAAERLYRTLEHGIEERVILLSSALTKRQREQAYAAIEDLSSAKLLITTPPYAFLDRCDLTQIIIEQCGSTHYIQRTRPYLHLTAALQTYARVAQRALIFGDILPPTEIEYPRRHDWYQTADEHPNRIPFPCSVTVVPQTEKIEPDRPMQILAHATQEKIRATLRAKENVFLYAARRGLATFVVCMDCNYIFRCPDSGAPYTLLRTHEHGEEKRWFVSPSAGRRVRAADTCPSCGGWRLKERGIGVQQIADSYKELFPEAPVHVFDHTTVTTHKRARSVIDSFQASRGGALIGTTMALPYLPENTSLSVVVSYDATRSVQTWRADEYVLRQLLQLRDNTAHELIVQTRTEDEPLLELLERGEVESFYSEEVTLREQLAYPPFATFILLTFQGSAAVVKNIETEIKQALADQDIHFYSDPYTTPEKMTRHGLLRLSQEQWPNQELCDRLRSLPPYIKVEVNPERIV